VTLVNDRLLESKMTKVEQARAWSPRVISKFETLINSADDHSQFRGMLCISIRTGPPFLQLVQKRARSTELNRASLP